MPVLGKFGLFRFFHFWGHSSSMTYSTIQGGSKKGPQFRARNPHYVDLRTLQQLFWWCPGTPSFTLGQAKNLKIQLSSLVNSSHQLPCYLLVMIACWCFMKTYFLWFERDPVAYNKRNVIDRRAFSCLLLSFMQMYRKRNFLQSWDTCFGLPLVKWKCDRNIFC